MIGFMKWRYNVFFALAGVMMPCAAAESVDGRDSVLTDTVPKFDCVMPPYNVADDKEEADSTSQSTVQLPGLVQKMADFQQKVVDKMTSSQRQQTSDKGVLKIVFMPPPLGNLPEYGFGLGVGVCGLFKTRNEPTLYTSKIPLNVRFGFTDPFSFKVRCSPILYFMKNNLKVAAEISYQQSNEHYFGIGYSTNKSMERDRLVTGYQSRRWQLSPEVEWRIGGSDFYMGVVADFSYDTMRNPGSYLTGCAEYVADGGTTDGLKLMDVGAGVDLSLDTRDVAYSPYDGAWIDLRAVWYSKSLGSDHNYGRLSLDYRHYKQIGGKRCVLSWGVSSSNVFGNDIPFARYATVGDIYTTRGYYGYQYRDKSVLKAHVEYRYMFNFNTVAGKLLLNRFGVAGWTGIAAMGENVLKYNAVLPEVGAGVRLQVAPRVNFRFDLGYDTVGKRVLRYFGISETF